MNTWINKNFVKRDYEATNIVAAESESAPGKEWYRVNCKVLIGLTLIYIENGIKYYGYL